MALLQDLLQLRGLVATIVLLRSCCGGGSSFRTIRMGYTSVSEAGPGLPLFTAMGYVDDQLIAFYETNTKMLQPRVSWMNKLEEEDPEFCKRYNRILQKDEEDFQENVEMLRTRYNQSVGFHIVQMMIICEVMEDGSRRGRWQYGYDGRDFLGFDMETDTWTAIDKEAQLTKRRWKNGRGILRRFKDYLESTCTEWLQKDQRYRLEQSLRKEAPLVTVSSTNEASGVETLICRAHGFYPKEIDITWMKDGENLDHETFRGILSPNSDGTFYTWISIGIDTEERGRYRCHVEHNGLLEPVVKAVKEAPLVTVSSTNEVSGMETLICRAHGFYPKEIDITWMKDGENLDHEIFRGILSPNSDGTFYTWISISVDTEERGRYRCHVEHDGLLEPVVKAVKAAESNWGIIIGSIVAFCVLVAVVLGIMVYRRSQRLKHSRCPFQE